MNSESQSTKSKALIASRVIVNIVWYLTMFAFILALGLATLMLTTDFRVAFVQLPLEVEFESVGDTPSVQLYDNGSPAIWGFRDLRVSAHDLPGLAYAMVMPLLLILGMMWILHHLRELLRTLTRGEPFARENPRRIRKIGYALLAAGPVYGLFVFVYGFIYSKALDIPGARVEASMDAHGFVIFTGLIVLVIAQVFENGVRLQQDQDLTV